MRLRSKTNGSNCFYYPNSLPASAFIAKQEVDFEHDNDGQRVLYLPAIPKKDGE
jgi:hypothetical protein